MDIITEENVYNFLQIMKVIVIGYIGYWMFNRKGKKQTEKKEK